jgi:hypothetical protein
LQFLAEPVRTPLQIDRENARPTRAINGTTFTGWFQFQPLWDQIVKEQPDLLCRVAIGKWHRRSSDRLRGLPVRNPSDGRLPMTEQMTPPPSSPAQQFSSA